ncbi:uncharacterized protein LOC127433051 [Myxocyprinus asiaticus]|uniref:uncharacterized protein LOC127433051 n=1 Tax=Myxocyprinus asiaticus TaxID=70543 RepID=UPI002221B4B3|nr:uncharacterized protein LOC127433051 [Myxocyprinus asiaticus]XP_051540648.1 uncharacterized protein LOC127433051 [Myxocyprinus asiaticus]
MNQEQLHSEEEIIQGNNYFIIETGNSCNAHKKILNYLQYLRPGLKQVQTEGQCDMILVFCPIVSRAGTDMESALNELNKCSASKPAIFIVLHHTYDSNIIIPGSSRFINRRNTLTVDCLFHEDMGLLNCDINNEAFTIIAKHFKQQEMESWVLFFIKNWRGILLASGCLLTIYIMHRII